MNILAIETSTNYATVALLSRENIQVESQDNIRQHAQYILPMIDKCLRQANISCQQLDGVAFGAGPGSFTGLRVACSVAKGLAFAYDLPLFPVSTLASIAYDAFQTLQKKQLQAEILAVMDARMQQLYWSHFHEPFIGKEPQVNYPKDIIIPENVPLILAGTGIDTYQSQFSKRLNKSIVKRLEIFPHAKTMIELVVQQKISQVSVAQAAPIYVRNQVTQGDNRG